MKLLSLALLVVLVFLANVIFVSAQDENETAVNLNTTGGGSSSNSSSLADSGSVPLIAGGKIYKTLFFSEPVKSIEFEVSDNVWTGRPFPEKVIYLPKEVSYLDNLRNVYSYFRITANKINKSNLVLAEIKLNIQRDWVDKQALNTSDLELLIYETNGWTDSDINMSYFGENSEDYFYLAEVPDFSYFAIVQKKEKPVVQTPIEEVKDEPVYIPEPKVLVEEPINNMKTFGFVVLVLVVVALFFFSFMRSKKS